MYIRWLHVWVCTIRTSCITRKHWTFLIRRRSASRRDRPQTHPVNVQRHAEFSTKKMCAYIRARRRCRWGEAKRRRKQLRLAIYFCFWGAFEPENPVCLYVPFVWFTMHIHKMHSTACRIVSARYYHRHMMHLIYNVWKKCTLIYFNMSPKTCYILTLYGLWRDDKLVWLWCVNKMCDYTMSAMVSTSFRIGNPSRHYPLYTKTPFSAFLMAT